MSSGQNFLAPEIQKAPSEGARCGRLLVSFDDDADQRIRVTMLSARGQKRSWIVGELFVLPLTSFVTIRLF
jgi:hypothetical protein